MKKTISILGSTGSIGVNALKVIDNLSGQFTVKYLSANSNIDRLYEQIMRYRPDAVAITSEQAARDLSKKLKGKTEVLSGRKGLLEIAARNDVQLMLNGLVGSAGMEPTLYSIQAGVNVALSNKESLVMAGSLITAAMEKSGAKIFPVDSEHSAVWQCLAGEKMADVSKIILTGSGGPFRTKALHEFQSVTPDEALKHPNWNMGNKITIDSATMMNKGLEVIETHWLFGINMEQIEIVVHPQSIIHSLVEFKDGSIKAQLGIPDMKVPIQYAMTYPQHADATWEKLDLVRTGQLTFEAPDFHRFPCIQLAYDALQSGGTTPAVLNVANEQAVYRFLKKELKFTDIPKVIEKACAKHPWEKNPALEDLLALEHWATQFVHQYQA